MIDVCFILKVCEVGDSVVILLFLEVIWRGKNLVKLCCLSCCIFRRENRLYVFATVIYFDNEVVFNSANSVISFANHLDGSSGISLAYRWSVPTSLTKTLCS